MSLAGRGKGEEKKGGRRGGKKVQHGGTAALDRQLSSMGQSAVWLGRGERSHPRQGDRGAPQGAPRARRQQRAQIQGGGRGGRAATRDGVSVWRWVIFSEESWGRWNRLKVAVPAG